MIERPPMKRVTEEEMYCSYDIYFLGSSYIVYNELVEIFEQLWENKIIQWQEINLTDDDQNLVLQLYYDKPELFSNIFETPDKSSSSSPSRPTLSYSKVSRLERKFPSCSCRILESIALSGVEIVDVHAAALEPFASGIYIKFE